MVTLTKFVFQPEVSAIVTKNQFEAKASGILFGFDR